MVVFTYAISDFGAPKVIGGNFNVLAIDMFKQVVGQQDFPKGAVVGICCWCPSVATYIIDGSCDASGAALLSARSVPYVPEARAAFDALMTRHCMLVLRTAAGGARHGGLGPRSSSSGRTTSRSRSTTTGSACRRGDPVAGLHQQPEDGDLRAPRLRLDHRVRRGLPASRRRAASTAAVRFVHLLAMLPMARPGHGAGPGLHLVLRRTTANPLHFLYGDDGDPGRVGRSFTTTPRRHLTAVTAFKQIDNEFEAVSASLKVPF